MNKKLLALIIASSILAQPMTILAQGIEKTTQETALAKAENTGFKKGVATALAASSFAVITYIAATLKQGLFIPAKINWRIIPTPTAFRTECQDNQLFNAMSDIKGDVAIRGASVNHVPFCTTMPPIGNDWPGTPTINTVSLDVKQNMIEKIGYYPNALAYACMATLFGTFIYYLSLKHKPQVSDDTTTLNTLERPASESV
jgi:hypothetical protein